MASNGLQDYADFSLPIPPNRYIDDPEYFCRFHPRVHKETQASDDATVQCQIDVFGRANVGFVKGCLSLRSGGWTSLTYPYCLPERLALVSYINEVAFFQNGRLLPHSSYSSLTLIKDVDFWVPFDVVVFYSCSLKKVQDIC